MKMHKMLVIPLYSMLYFDMSERKALPQRILEPSENFILSEKKKFSSYVSSSLQRSRPQDKNRQEIYWRWS